MAGMATTPEMVKYSRIAQKSLFVAGLEDVEIYVNESISKDYVDNA